MLDQDEDDPPRFMKPEARVTLDMISTEDLVQELVDRKRLMIISARRKVPREIYSQTGFLSAMDAIVACDLSKQIVLHNLTGEETMQIGSKLEFFSSVVVLIPVDEERPI